MESQDNDNKQNDQAVQETPSKGNRPIWTVAIIVLLALILIGGFFYMKHSKKSDNASGANSTAIQNSKSTVAVKFCDSTSTNQLSIIVGTTLQMSGDPQTSALDGVNTSSCQYVTTGSATSAQSLTLLKKTYQDNTAAQAAYDNEAKLAPTPAQPISNLGDRAVWYAQFNALTVLKGKNILTITYSSGGQDVQAKASKIAEQLAAQLQ